MELMNPAEDWLYIAWRLACFLYENNQIKNSSQNSSNAWRHTLQYTTEP